MQIKSKTLLASTLLCLLSLCGKGQATEIVESPLELDCMVNLLGSEWNSDEVIAMFQDEFYRFEHLRNEYDFKTFGFVSFPVWFGEYDGLRIEAASTWNGLENTGRMMHRLECSASNRASAERYLHSYLKKWGLSNVPKENKKALKKSKQYESCKQKGDNIFFWFKLNDDLRVRITWNSSNSKDLWVSGITWEYTGPQRKVDACVTLKALSVDDVPFDPDNSDTGWRLIGRKLSHADVVLLTQKHGYYLDPLDLDPPLYNFGFPEKWWSSQLKEDGDSFEVKYIIYNLDISGLENSLFSVLGGIDSISLRKFFGERYKYNEWVFEIHCSEKQYEPLFTLTFADHQQTAFFSYQGETTSKLDQNLGYYFPSTGCVIGNCENDAGIWGYSDGYRYIGYFKDGAFLLGSIKDPLGNTVEEIDMRPEEVKPSPPVNPREKLYSSLTGLKSHEDRIRSEWSGYIENTAKMYTAYGADETTKYFGYARNNLARLLEYSAAMKKAYSNTISLCYDLAYCTEIVSVLRDAQVKARSVESLMQSVSMGSFNLPSSNEFADYIEPKVNELDGYMYAIFDARNEAYTEFNDCGD